MEELHNFFNNYNMHRKEAAYKECIYKSPDCSGQIIKAHSIQNNRILNKLSKNGEVLYFDFGDLEYLTKFKKTGRKKASTFSGFCSYHDTTIFSPIENKRYVIGDKEQEFLFAYRAFARGYATKKTAINLSNKVSEILKSANQIPSTHSELAKYALKRTMMDFEAYRNILNYSLKNKDYYKIRTDKIVFDKEYSFAVSGAFYLLGDINGRIINDTLNPNKSIAPFFLTIFPDCGETFVLMSYLNKDKHKYSFIKDQIMNATEESQKIILSNLVVVNSENIVFSPDKFSELTDSERNQFYDIYERTSSFQPVLLAPFPNFNIFV